MPIVRRISLLRVPRPSHRVRRALRRVPRAEAALVLLRRVRVCVCMWWWGKLGGRARWAEPRCHVFQIPRATRTGAGGVYHSKFYCLFELN